MNESSITVIGFLFIFFDNLLDYQRFSSNFSKTQFNLSSPLYYFFIPSCLYPFVHSWSIWIIKKEKNIKTSKGKSTV